MTTVTVMGGNADKDAVVGGNDDASIDISIVIFLFKRKESLTNRMQFIM